MESEPGAAGFKAISEGVRGNSMFPDGGVV
jgi:hypothetical protein